MTMRNADSTAKLPCCGHSLSRRLELVSGGGGVPSEYICLTGRCRCGLSARIVRILSRKRQTKPTMAQKKEKRGV